MTSDADLIYNALLRAEKKVEAFLHPDDPPDAQVMAHLAMGIIQTIREEVGNGLAARTPAGLDAISGKGG